MKKFKRFIFPKPRSISVDDSKRALLIGINYIGMKGQLSGCINDTRNMKRFLMSIGYSEENIIVVTEKSDKIPTKETILKELKALVTSGATNLVFCYSGHGSYITDTTGDEEDRRDEVLVPLDYLTNGVIIDDDLKVIINKMNKNSKLMCVFDCCHSGTCLDLPYVYTEGRMVSNNSSETKAEVVLISGCLDNQTSADTTEEGEQQGALTYALCKSFKKPSVKSIEDLIINVRAILKNKYTQSPLLSSGKQISTDISYLNFLDKE